MRLGDHVSTRLPHQLTAAVVAFGLVAVAVPIAGVGPAAASAACTLTQGTDFTSRATLQTALDASTCPGTLTVQFTTGLPMTGGGLSWSVAIPLVLQGAGQGATTLDGLGTFGILSSTSGQQVTINDLTMINGSATNGGAVATDAAVTITNSTLSGNTATGTGGADGGGAVYAGDVTITGSTITGNSTGGGIGGGGIASNNAVITNSTISNNSATASSSGGGGVSAYGDVTATNSVLANNNTNGSGGAIIGFEVTLTGSQLTGNTGFYGGAVDSAADGNGHSVTVTGSTLSANTAVQGGGAIMVSPGTNVVVAVSDSTISNNVATGDHGGGIYSSAATFTIVDSTISGNSAGGRGGGLLTGSIVGVTNSTIAGNHAGTYGGGISGNGSWSARLKFATVVANTATTGAANIGRDTASTLTSVGSVIATEGASSCAGVSAADSEFNVTSTGDSSCGLSGASDTTSTWSQLALGALATNGNPTGTKTMLPQVGSSLIDVVPAGVGQDTIGPHATDQRGVTRAGSFWVGAAQGSGLAQTPLRGCVTKPKRIPANSVRRLMKADCVTNIGQHVGVAVSGHIRRGDTRTYALRCKVSPSRLRFTTATGNGTRYCLRGKLVIRTFGKSLKLRITWSAPATTSYAAFTTVKKYKT